MPVVVQPRFFVAVLPREANRIVDFVGKLVLHLPIGVEVGRPDDVAILVEQLLRGTKMIAKGVEARTALQAAGAYSFACEKSLLARNQRCPTRCLHAIQSHGATIYRVLARTLNDRECPTAFGTRDHVAHTGR